MFCPPTDVSGYAGLQLSLYPEGVADQEWLIGLLSDNIPPYDFSCYPSWIGAD